MRLIDADTLKAEFTGNFHENWHYTAIRAMVDEAPTIQPQGIDKDRLIEFIDDIKDNTMYEDEFDEYSPYEIIAIMDELIDFINQQPTTDVPDTNVGEIPQLYKDRVEHVIKVLESCKQRHIDIVTDLPHTVEIERGTISAYSMALKVVRECLLQPCKESE
jgi:hypothetical protein